MAVGSPRMWHCTESSPCLCSWARLHGAADHTYRAGQPQPDSSASPNTSELSSTWAMALFMSHHFPGTVNSHFYLGTTSLIPANTSSWLFIAAAVAGSWGCYFKVGNINFYSEREGLHYFCLFPNNQHSLSFGWHDRKKAFSGFQSYYNFIWLWFTPLLVMQKVVKETRRAIPKVRL